MTSASDEQAQSGTGRFRDVVDVHLLDESLLLAARVARAPGEASARAMALVVDEGTIAADVNEEVEGGIPSWDAASAGPLRLETNDPLERWTLALDAAGARVEVDLTAVTPAADLAEPATAAIARAAGVRRYAHLCEARGTAEIAGRRRSIETAAIRTHHWGPVGEGGRARFVTVVTEEGLLLTVAAVRPPGAAAHGEELLGAYSARAGDAEGDALPFETVRLSTVFAADGQPSTLGAELFRPGEELPSRLAGVAAGGAADTSNGARTSLSLFRFRLDGVPALGAYEIEEST